MPRFTRYKKKREKFIGNVVVEKGEEGRIRVLQNSFLN